MHTLWKGNISFGLVNVPVKMYAATEEKEISFRLLHKDCGIPISTMKWCKFCSKELAADEVQKGYEYEKDRFVPFGKSELDMATAKNKLIQILDFVDPVNVDTLLYQKGYYLGPDELGVNAYNLLFTALTKTNRVGIAVVTLRSKTYLSVVRPKQTCLVLEMLHYADEVRSEDQVPNISREAIAEGKQLDLACKLIRQLSTSFEHGKYENQQRANLLKTIEMKVAGEAWAAPIIKQENNVADLLSALQASLELYQGKVNKKSKNKKAVPAENKIESVS